jgi:hypothetical protein
VDEEDLLEVAIRCRDQVLRYAGRLGFTHSDFCTRLRAYRDLRQEDQFRALVLIAKMSDISSAVEAWSGREVWRFYATKYEPPGAFNYERDRVRALH